MIVTIEEILSFFGIESNIKNSDMEINKWCDVCIFGLFNFWNKTSGDWLYLYFTKYTFFKACLYF